MLRAIAERVRALNNNTALLKTESETSLNGILAVNEQGMAIFTNRRFAEIWVILQAIIDEKDVNHVLGKIKRLEEFISRVNYLYKHRLENSHEEVNLADGRWLDRSLLW